MGYSNHTLTRVSGSGFKASWKASNIPRGATTCWQFHANAYNIHTGKAKVIQWSPAKAQRGPVSSSNSIGSDSAPCYTLDGSKVWPNTEWVSDSVNLQLGLDRIGYSVAWFYYVSPYRPTIEMEASDSNRQITWTINSDPDKVRCKNSNFWTHCRYWFQQVTEGNSWPSVPDWATGGWTGQFQPTDSSLTRTYTHTASDAAPETSYAVRVVARNEGPAGESLVRYGGEHVYGRPRTPTLTATTKGNAVTLSVDPNANWWHPIDHVTVERQVSSQLDPSGSWKEVYDEDVSTTSLRACVDADPDRLEGLGEDKAAWYRVRVWHDYEANSAQAYAAQAVLCGAPAAPSVTAEYQSASDTITAEVDVESDMSVETWLRVMAGTEVVVDWMRWDASSGTAETICDAAGNAITFDPTLTYRVHVQNRTVASTVAGTSLAIDYGGERRSAEGVSAQVSSESQAEVVGASLSAVVVDSVTLNADGEGVTVEYHWGTDDLGNVTITDKGTSIEWTDASGGWISTDEPTTHRAADGSGRTGVVSIDGLKEGTLYHVRLRRYVTVDGADGYGPEASFTVVPQSTPSKPVLSAAAAVKAGSGVEYSWTFSDEGDTPQSQAELLIGSDLFPIEGATGSYVHQTEEGQAGATLSAQVRVSTGGGWSEWSDAVATAIAAPPTCTASLAGDVVTAATTTQEFEGDGETAAFELANQVTAIESVTVDGTAAAYALSDSTVTLDAAPADGAVVSVSYSHPASAYGGTILTALPLAVNLGGSGDQWRVSVTCAQAARLVLPNGSETHAVGDAIAYQVMAQGGAVGCQPIEGAGYDVEVVCVDTSTGLESDPVMLGFGVAWANQATAPGATVTIADGAAVVTPSQGDGATSGETCRIWRMTADGAAIAFDGAEWGTAYVDEVPGYGCSYVVEAITPDGDREWTEVACPIGGTDLCISWRGGSVSLPWNLELSSSYAPTFERRAHLDGTRAGYWQRGTDRDFTASGVLLRGSDELTAIRALARWNGICYCRAPEGIAFPCAVNVQMAQGHDGSTAAIDLSISEVDDDGTWQLAVESEDNDGTW